MGKKLSEVFAESGIPLDYQAGGQAPPEPVDREIRREPGSRAHRLRQLYFDTLSSATNAKRCQARHSAIMAFKAGAPAPLEGAHLISLTPERLPQVVEACFGDGQDALTDAHGPIVPAVMSCDACS